MGGLIIGSNGGALVGPGGGGFTFDVVAPEVGILDRTLTVHNQSGSAVASGKQWYFGHGFVQGEVASGQKVVLKSSAVELPTYQYGSVETWPDGSLRTAAFKVELPASINHLASLDLDLSAETGAPDNTSTIINADVTTNSDLSIEVVESGTTYLSDFNDLIASAELVEVGPACKTWRAVERLHTSAPVAHDRLFALWYLTWFNNDTYRLWCAVGNGYINELTIGYDVTSVILKDGVTTLMSETSVSINLRPGGFMPICDSDGTEYWSDGYPDLTNQHDTDYIYDAHLVPRLADALEALTSAPSVPAYTFNDNLQVVWLASQRITEQSGWQDYLGHIPVWAARVMTAMSGTDAAKMRACNRLNRVRATGYMCAPAHFLSANGEAPNMVSNLRTYTDMDAHGTRRFHSSESWRSTTGGNGWSEQDMDHTPNACFLEWLLTGDLWQAEMVRLLANHMGAWESVSVREATVDSITRSAIQDGYQERSTAWTSRQKMCASLATPDAHVAKDYFDDWAEDQYTHLWKRATIAAASGGHNDSQKTLGFLLPGSQWNGWNIASPWMQNYAHICMIWAAFMEIPGADGCVDEYVKKFALGWANAAVDRTAWYRLNYWKTDVLVLDSVKEAYSSWDDAWGGMNAVSNNYGHDTATMDISGVTGTFVLGETITGSISTQTARIIQVVSATQLRILAVANTGFTLAETITGGTSGATATFDSRTYKGYPNVPDSTKRVGDPAPDGDPGLEDEQYHSLFLGVMGMLGEYTTGADQVTAKAHFDTWWASRKTDFGGLAGIGNYTNLMMKYDGAVE